MAALAAEEEEAYKAAFDAFDHDLLPTSGVVNRSEAIALVIKWNKTRFSFRPGFKNPKVNNSGRVITMTSGMEIKRLLAPSFQKRSTAEDRVQLMQDLVAFLAKEFSVGADEDMDQADFLELWSLWGRSSGMCLTPDAVNAVVDMFNWDKDNPCKLRPENSTVGEYGVLTPRDFKKWLVGEFTGTGGRGKLRSRCGKLHRVLLERKLFMQWDQDHSGLLEVKTEVCPVVDTYNEYTEEQISWPEGAETLDVHDFIRWVEKDLSSSPNVALEILHILLFLVECTQFFEALDFHGTGEVTQDEIIYAVYGKDPGDLEESERAKVWDAMKNYDADGSNSLNRKEFRDYCHRELDSHNEEYRTKFLEECTANALHLFNSDNGQINSMYEKWVPPGHKCLSKKDVGITVKLYNKMKDVKTVDRLNPPVEYEWYTPRQVERWLIAETGGGKNLYTTLNRMQQLIQENFEKRASCKVM